ncbi:hypothetical protein [Streptomyces sp. NPDC002132]
MPAVIGALIIVLTDPPARPGPLDIAEACRIITEQPGHWGTLDRDGPP